MSISLDCYESLMQHRIISDNNNMGLEKTLESPLDCKEIQPVHSKDQPWVFFGRNDANIKLKLQYFGHLMRRVDSLQRVGHN